jgi:hypothetical protein
MKLHDYINQIRAVIKKTHEEYRHDNATNNALLWEMIKLKIREFTIKHATSKIAQISWSEEVLEKGITWQAR